MVLGRRTLRTDSEAAGARACRRGSRTHVSGRGGGRGADLMAARRRGRVLRTGHMSAHLSLCVDLTGSAHSGQAVSRGAKAWALHTERRRETRRRAGERGPRKGIWAASLECRPSDWYDWNDTNAGTRGSSTAPLATSLRSRFGPEKCTREQVGNGECKQFERSILGVRGCL